MVRKTRAVVAAMVVTLVAYALPGPAAGQAAQPVTLESFGGAWEGSAQTPNGEVTLRSVFKVENGKLTGTIESSMGPIPVASGSIVDDKLMVTIEFQGTPGSLVCRLQGTRIEGTWQVGANSGPFSLMRAGTGDPSAGGGVVGSWSGEVQIAGQTRPFTLTLREDGGALAGEIGSSEGSVPLSKAAWVGGTLQFEFTYVGGQPVVMTGKLDGGKLLGTIDFNKGEAAGTWSAARK